MRKLILWSLMLFGLLAYGQSPQVDSERFVSKTNAEEAAFSAFSPGVRLIYNSEQAKWRYRVGAGAWQDLATGGGGSGGIATSDQTITRGAALYNTATSGDVITYQQEGVDLMVLGGNNDQALRVRAFEALSGQTHITFLSSLRAAQLDISGSSAVTWSGGLVRNTASEELYFSDGVNWIKLSERLAVDSESDEESINLGMADDEASLDAMSLSGNDVVFCKTCPPAKTFTGTAIPLTGYFTIDDTSTDTATWTIGTSRKGGLAEITINLASAPTITGASQIPNTQAFAPNTLQLLTVKNIQGTVYYYFTTL